MFLRVADGNESDKAVFAQILCDFKNQLNLDTLMVADSALYTAPNLAQMVYLKWLCRVPLTVKQAKELVSHLTEKDFVPSQIKGYRWSQLKSKYGGIEQRWLVVESEARRQSDLRKFEKDLEKSEKGASQKLRDLCSAKFKCQQDAQEAANNLSRKLKCHNLVDIQTIEVLPKSAKKDSLTAKDLGVITYQVKARLERDKRRIEIESRGAGLFVLATNILDVEELSNDEMVSKQYSSVKA